jgi:hypothetical protein
MVRPTSSTAVAPASRHHPRPVLHRVHDEVDGRLRREHELVLRRVLLEDVVLGRAGQAGAVDAALVADDPVHGEDHRRRRVDGQRRRHVLERDPVEQRVGVDHRVDRDPDLADLAAVDRVVGVVAEQRRQVEVGREAGLAVGEQVLVAPVGVLGLAEAGDLADRPRAAAVHARVRPAREGILAGQPDVALVGDPREIGRRVDVLDREARQRRERLAPRGDALVVAREPRLAPQLDGGVDLLHLVERGRV